MKTIYEYTHVKSVSCIVLIDKTSKEIAGKIIANWSDNPNGSVCTAQVIIYNSEDRGLKAKKSKQKYYSSDDYMPELAIGKASGYGYDKLWTAIYAAMRKGYDWEFEHRPFAGVGESGTREFFSLMGLDYVYLV